MTNEELNTKVYEKLFDEQQKYKRWLLTQSPEEILNHSYEYTVREDIVLGMEYFDLSGEQAAALLESPSPLYEIFRDFEKIEGDHMEIIRNCIENRADELIKKHQDKLKNLPIPLHSGTDAREHGEVTHEKNRKFSVLKKLKEEHAEPETKALTRKKNVER